MLSICQLPILLSRTAQISLELHLCVELRTKKSFRIRSTSLYHCRQCSIVLKPRSDRIDYTVVCFMTHDCSRTRCENTVRPVRAESALNAICAWFKYNSALSAEA